MPLLIKYTNTEQAPLLTDAAIKLSVNGITESSPEALKLAAINDMRGDLINATNLEANNFILNLYNKVLISTLFKRLQFKDPISEQFFKAGISISAAKEVFDNQLLDAHDYDPNKRYPDNQTKANTLSTILVTVKQSYLTNTIRLAGVKAAFASEIGYGEWLSNQIKLLTESLQVILYKTLTPLFRSEIKNVITLDAKINSWDKIFVAINGIAANMKLPTIKYNLGFTTPSNAANKSKVRHNSVHMDSLLMMGSTNIQNALNGEVSTVKFHNAYFDIKSYKGYIPLDVDDTEIILLADNACEGYFRVNEVASNTWAANLSVEYFLHYWYVFGFIPWANGVRIKFTHPEEYAVVENTLPIPTLFTNTTEEIGNDSPDELVEDLTE